MNIKQKIDQLLLEHKTLRKVAKSTGIDVGYLSCLYAGIKDNPSNATCAALGLKKRMIIEYSILTKDNQG